MKRSVWVSRETAMGTYEGGNYQEETQDSFPEKQVEALLKWGEFNLTLAQAFICCNKIRATVQPRLCVVWLCRSPWVQFCRSGFGSVGLGPVLVLQVQGSVPQVRPRRAVPSAVQIPNGCVLFRTIVNVVFSIYSAANLMHDTFDFLSAAIW